MPASDTPTAPPPIVPTAEASTVPTVPPPVVPNAEASTVPTVPPPIAPTVPPPTGLTVPVPGPSHGSRPAHRIVDDIVSDRRSEDEFES